MSNSVWRLVSDDPPPEHKMVLLSWGSLEGSCAGYWYEQDLYISWCIDGSYHDGDGPRYWMELPELPR